MKYFALALALITAYTSHAQEKCATEILVEQDIHAHPERAAIYEAQWNRVDIPSRKAEGEPYIIPTVVHVFHDNGRGNISYEQVLDALRIVNEDFSRTNPDTGDTRDLFKPVAGGLDIEFRLAQTDPQGQCTNGIVRINNSEASSNADNNIKFLSQWDETRYFNVWVVNDIASFGSGGTILGYAQFPGTGDPNTFGIVIRNDRMGSIGTAIGSGDRTLTHEFGHCLNLLHVFQSGCGGSNCSGSGDRVCDTPPMLEATYGCSKGQNTCSNDSLDNSSAFQSDVPDPIENYMSYDDCQNMFTQGQVTRMISALENSSELSNLWTSNNLSATGVDNMYAELCQTNFNYSKTVICAGQSVVFSDVSFHNPDTLRWEFEGGEPHTSGDDEVEVFFPNPGTYTVNLTAYRGSDSLTRSEQQLITVLPPNGRVTPMVEGFESNATLEQTEWFPNPTSSVNRWDRYGGTGYTGGFSLKCSNDGSDFSHTIYSPSYNATALLSGELSFYYAHAYESNTGPDALQVYVSSNCGGSWKSVWSQAGPGLATTGNRFGDWEPAGQNQWRKVTVPIDTADLTATLRLRFDFVGGGGNNLYLDDVNISGSVNPTPALNLPYDSSIVTVTNPVLDWFATNNPSYYRVELDTNTSFNSSLYQSNLTVSQNTGSETGDTEFEPDSLMPGITYYWRARSIKDGAASDWSPVWTFTVADTATQSAPGPSSIDELITTLDVSVYPNPGSDVIHIVVNPEASITNIRIFSASGREVFQKQGLLGNHPVIDPNLPKGFYIVSIETQSGLQVRKPLIRQ